MRTAHTAWPASASPAALVGALALTRARRTRTSFIDEIPRGSLRAGAFVRAAGRQPGAQHARRACRLQVVRAPAWPTSDVRRWRAEQQAREAAVREMVRRHAAGSASSVRWRSRRSAAAASPTTASAFSWNVLRQRRGRRAGRPARDELLGSGLGRRRLHAHDAGRRRVAGSCCDKDFSPFVGTGFSVDLGAAADHHFDQMTARPSFLDGKGVAHSVSLSAGLQLPSAMYD